MQDGVDCRGVAGEATAPIVADGADVVADGGGAEVALHEVEHEAAEEEICVGGRGWPTGRGSGAAEASVCVYAGGVRRGGTRSCQGRSHESVDTIQAGGVPMNVKPATAVGSSPRERPSATGLSTPLTWEEEG